MARKDLDGDGRYTDFDIAAQPVPSSWSKIGLRGPQVIARWIGRNAKRMAVAIVGAAFLRGVAMLVLPGPGIVVSLIGLAILATEFAWAERMLDRATSTTAKAAGTVTDSKAGRALLMLSTVALIAAGIAVLVVWDRFLVAGIGLIVAGLAAGATLLPPVQRWLDRMQDASLERQRIAD
jgi:hypothetical protein